MDTSLHNVKSTSVWLISHCFGGNDIPSNTLRAAVSNSLIPRGGVAVLIESSRKRLNSYLLFNSLPLAISSHMPVHVNGNFWIDDSRKHLEISGSQSDWNCHVTNTVISDAYVNALVCCKDFLQDKGTDWYYNKFPTKGKTQDSKLHSFGLDKAVYRKIIENKICILEQDSVSAPSTVTWLPVVEQGRGHFFTLNASISLNVEKQLRELLMKFGVKLCKAPKGIYEGIVSAASAYTVSSMIDQTTFIEILKSLNLRQHADLITENVILLLKYCLSSKEGLNAIKGTPLLLTSDGGI